MLKKMILAASAAVFTLTGCASSGLVHDKNYLRAVSITGENEKNLTFNFFTENGDSVSASGKDIDSAQRSAEIKSGKPIFTGYTELVILGDCSYRETLDYLLNDWKVSPSCIIAYSENGGELLEKTDAEVIYGSIKQAVDQGKIPECDIITVLGELLSDSNSAEISEITNSGSLRKHTLK
jgi:hypothetical protein rflaF_05384